MTDPVCPSSAPSPAALAPTLDQRLAQALVPPSLPPHFRARVLAAANREPGDTAGARRQALVREYAAAREQLRVGQMRLQRDAAALVLGVVFIAGACVRQVLPWLHAQWGVDGAAAMPLLAVLIGLSAGASVWVGRFGTPSTFGWWRRG